MTSSADLWGDEPADPAAAFKKVIREEYDLGRAEMEKQDARAATGSYSVGGNSPPVGFRMSLLPITQYCGTAGELSERYGAGRAAAMSSAFHAWVAKTPEHEVLVGRLTQAEREEIASWKVPATVVAGDGVELVYSEAMKEFEVAFDYVGPSGETVTYSIGHPDMAWIVEVPLPSAEHRTKVAFVGDIKKSVWTVESGPDSLQLHAYGMATAALYGCDAYCLGIWSATDGEWLWSKDWVFPTSAVGKTIRDRIIQAATHKGQAYAGEHCRGCFARMHCPEHLLPAALLETYLAPLTEEGDLAKVDHVMVQRIQAMIELGEKALKNVQAAVSRGELDVRDPESGKRYLPVMMPGRFSMKDGKRLAAKLGDEAGEFVTQGQPYATFRWKKSRP